jgi:ankyrin repeat protein
MRENFSKNKNYEIIQFALKAGLSIDACNEFNETPLMLSCFHGYTYNSLLFIAAGADVSCRNMYLLYSVTLPIIH